MKQTAKLIGISPEMQQLRAQIVRVAKSDAKILITGESGVGKDLVARAIHSQSPRASSPFIAVNCAGLPESLLESELFGHVKGSFTGAYRDRAGKLELANHGTVFLDEVGEMTLRMQGLLLRFLETGELQKVGSDRTTGPVNVRVIAATNRDLRALITEGKFREDLFYRLNVIRMLVPPLRERRVDIPLLIEHALARFDRVNGLPSGNGNSAGRESENEIDAGRRRSSWSLAPDVVKALTEYAWPGNVRELENTIEIIVVNVPDRMVVVDDLPPEIRQQNGVTLRPKRERRHTIADELYRNMRDERVSFWRAVYPRYMQREITKDHVRDLVRKGLEEARGNYRIVAELFNLEPTDYKRFLNFLRNHDCQLPFSEYRH
jgi:transcriptional regulator with GAF, ATPase, and Fis domain